MTESLKELSDRAPPGPWDLSPQELDDWGMVRAAFDPKTGFRPVVCSIRSHDDEAEQAAARQEGRQPKSVQARADFIIALERAYRAGRLHDDTALATAVARAREEGLEEAARIAHARAEMCKAAAGEWLGPEDVDGTDPQMAACMSAAMDQCEQAAKEILALCATTPTEARQTETGDAR